MRPLLGHFHDQFAKQAIDPREPFAGEPGGVILVEGFVHETGAGMGVFQRCQMNDLCKYLS